MNRRSFVGRSIAVLFGATQAQAVQPGREIHMTERWAYGGSFDELQMCHVYLDGEDVTKRCFYASEPKGEVGLYIKDDYGRSVLAKPFRASRLLELFKKKAYLVNPGNRLVSLRHGELKTEHRRGVVAIREE